MIERETSAMHEKVRRIEKMWLSKISNKKQKMNEDTDGIMSIELRLI